MMLGYVRVSAKDQNPERQIVKMRELGIQERFIFVDKASGKDFNRERYKAMKEMTREGDLIYFDSLDRLGRDFDGIIEEWKYITQTLNADIVCLDNETLFDSQKFRSMGDIGKLMEIQFLSLLAYVAEQERKKIRQRQAEGIAVARAEGRKLGRPLVDFDEKKFKEVYQDWRASKITAVSAMKLCNLSKMTFYRRVKELEKATS